MDLQELFLVENFHTSSHAMIRNQNDFEKVLEDLVVHKQWSMLLDFLEQNPSYFQPGRSIGLLNDEETKSFEKWYQLHSSRISSQWAWMPQTETWHILCHHPNCSNHTFTLGKQSTLELRKQIESSFENVKNETDRNTSILAKMAQLGKDWYFIPKRYPNWGAWMNQHWQDLSTHYTKHQQKMTWILLNER